MNIILNGRYQITSDQQNYILQEKKYPNPKSKFTKDPNKWKWVDVGYYGKYARLVKVLLEKEIKDSEAEDLISIKKLMLRVEEDIVEQIERVESE